MMLFSRIALITLVLFKTGCNEPLTPVSAIKEPDSLVAEEWLPIASASNRSTERLEEISGLVPKNIILVILDGVGMNQVLAARYRYYGIEGKLNMERFPGFGMMDTHSADSSIITDSGASATAMATGHKTFNGMIGMGPDSTISDNLVKIFQQTGKSTALISYGNLSGATPAAFATHTVSRENKGEISQQLLLSGVDLLFGDAIDFYDPSFKHINTDTSFIRSAGYTLWKNRLPDGQVITGRKNIILYDTLVKESASLLKNSVVTEKGAPALKDVVRSALPYLSNNKNGFFMMLEEDWTDSWGHENKAGMMTWHLKNADDALEPLIEFARNNKETLILVTADHETGGMTIPLMSSPGKRFGVKFSTREHTIAMVPVFSYGPGSQYFKGSIDNTDIFRYLSSFK